MLSFDVAEDAWTDDLAFPQHLAVRVDGHLVPIGMPPFKPPALFCDLTAQVCTAIAALPHSNTDAHVVMRVTINWAKPEHDATPPPDYTCRIDVVRRVGSEELLGDFLAREPIATAATHKQRESH